jgi:hypothetical protein
MTTDLRHLDSAGAFRPRRLLAPALAVLLAACAGTGGSRGDLAGNDPSAPLEQRALERWRLLIDRKPELAYAYLTPGYRATRPLAEYRGAPSNPTLQWTGISWHKAECEQPDSCQAKLLLDYEMTVQGAGKIPGIQELTERWLRIDGTWFHLPES